MVTNLRKIAFPRGGIPIRLDPSSGVPRTTRLTGSVQWQEPKAVVAATPVVRPVVRYPGSTSRGISERRIPIGTAYTRRATTMVPSRLITPIPALGAGAPAAPTSGGFAPSGGVGGGAGPAGVPGNGTSLGAIGGIGSSITSAGSGILNTVGLYIPLAIKIIIAVIVIKIVWWLIKGRRR